MPIGREGGKGAVGGTNNKGKTLRIRLPVVSSNAPEAVVVPLRHYRRTANGKKQLTVLRQDGHGQFYIDEYVERYAGSTDPYVTERYVNHLRCSRFNICISPIACHHYCAGPCNEHVAHIRQDGWYSVHGAPPYSRKKQLLVDD